MNTGEVYDFEKNKLEKVIALINEQIKKAQENFDKQEHFIIGFKEGQRGTQFTRQAMMTMYATEITNLNKSLPSPYFGKFGFSEETGKNSDIYIGKRAIHNDNELIAYDWRSPICSMYYDFNIGDAEYSFQNRTIKGKLLNKRQLVIKDSKLLDVEEQDTLSNDQILMKYLNENADSRLKSIIATIQKEQNLIIRSPLNNHYIIQGVAGSGKTTVALHRIAYLLYNEAKSINESEFMILGPNNYFLNYISELLPDLDIKNVIQSTFEEIALNNLGCKVKLESRNSTLQNVLQSKTDESIIKYKSSLEFLKSIEQFLKFYVKNHLQNDIVYEGIVLCKSEYLESIYNNSFGSLDNCYSTNINNFIKRISKKTKEESDDICHQVWLQHRDEFLSLDKDDPKRKKIINKTNSIQNEIKKGCVKQLKDYFKFININPLSLYIAYLENIDKFNDNIPVNINLLKEQSLKKLNKKMVGFEDLSPLLLINYLIKGIDAYKSFSHLVIDEAQDFSLAQYYLLKKLFPKCKFDIFGDINQSIYDYQSIKNWEELNTKIFDDKAIFLELNKSYRTTKQISDASNCVLKYLDYGKAECIARDGIDVEIVNSDNNISVVIEQIYQLLAKNYQTIAVICKDDKETSDVYLKLTKLGLNISKVSEQNNEYHGGLCIMPSYLSKGLEFDAVILYDVNSNSYMDDLIDMKLLYVSITRAMHELIINHTGELPVSLESYSKGQQIVNTKTLKKQYK